MTGCFDLVSSFKDINAFNNHGVTCCKLISKEEDLEMDKKEEKQVRSIRDIEVGMFLSTGCNKYCVLGVSNGKVDTIILSSSLNSTYHSSFHSFEAWSYTYSGEYTPIIKDTEAERKIKELEATIELAQKQLQEYKGMK